MTTATRETFRQRLVRRRHTALLVALVAMLAVRPLLGDTGIGPPLLSVGLLSVLLLALFTVQVDDLVGERKVLLAQKRRRWLIAWLLAVPAVIERFYLLTGPNHRLYLIGSVSWFLLFSFITWNLLRTLLKHKAVTGETISMSVSIYLLLGLTWGILYAVIFELNPAAFNLGASAGLVGATGAKGDVAFPILIYFSLTTISTAGFGDITPLSFQARYAAAAEAIAGQFYLAILVARLVGMHMSASATADVGNRPQAPEREEPPDASGRGDERAP